MSNDRWAPVALRWRERFDRWLLLVGRLSNLDLLTWVGKAFGLIVVAGGLTFGVYAIYDHVSVRIDTGEVVDRNYQEEYDHWHPGRSYCAQHVDIEGVQSCVRWESTQGHYHFHPEDCDVRVRGQDANTTDRVRIEERWIDVPCQTYDNYPIGSTWERGQR